MTLTLLKMRSKKYVIRELLKLIEKGEQIAEGYQWKNLSVFKDEKDNWESEINIFYRLYTDNPKSNISFAIASISFSAFEDRPSVSQRQQQIRFELNTIHKEIKEKIDELRDMITKIERNEYKKVFISSQTKRKASKIWKKMRFGLLLSLATIVVIIIMYDTPRISVIIGIITVALMIYFHYKGKQS